jgi:UDP-N-acetylglucosamine 1-carboxyvinyltransferase
LITAALLARGKITIKATRPIDILQYLNFLDKAGVPYQNNTNSISVQFPKERGYLFPVNINTGSEPLFSSDWMAPTVLLLATCSSGRSIVTDDVFPERLRCLDNLKQMGLNNVKVKKVVMNGREALKAAIDGNPNLVLSGGSAGSCTDLRGSTTLALSALVSKRDVILEDDFHLRRGYENYNHLIDKITRKNAR